MSSFWEVETPGYLKRIPLTAQPPLSEKDRGRQKLVQNQVAEEKPMIQERRSLNTTRTNSIGVGQEQELHICKAGWGEYFISDIV